MRPLGICFVGISLLISSLAIGQTLTNSNYFVESVVTGLNQPTTMAFVASNTILVCEKATGKVRRVVNGVIQMTDAIDLAVANSSERGLLGICLHPDFATNGFVYLYYSRAAVDAGTWLDNRVERFVYNGTTLTLDSTIIVFPSDPAQSNGPNHDGGIIMIGPDQKLYVITGELNRGRFTNPRIETNTDTTAVAGVGGIFRLNLDGSTPSDNPFISNTNTSIQKMYAYGIRNSFGMTFDPLTNYVWFTENGPNNYDEVNVMPMAGLNSGWLKIMGPDSRDYSYAENNFTIFNASDLTMLTNSYYQDPVFSWLTTIAPTAILFLTSPKMRPTERNQVLIADNNFSQLYFFQVNPARDGFVLSGTLADRVADTSTERQLNVFGTGWGVATDLKLGPDGYIYVVSLASGAIRRIRPNVEDLPPTSFMLLRGIVLSGGLPELAESDDMKMVIRPGVVLSSTEAPVQLVLNATSPFVSPSQLQFKLEASTDQANIGQTIQLYNYVTQSYETLDFRNATTTDSVVTVNVVLNAARFVDPATRAVQTKVSYKTVGPILSYPWQARLDQALWTITR